LVASSVSNRPWAPPRLTPNGPLISAMPLPARHPRAAGRGGHANHRSSRWSPPFIGRRGVAARRGPARAANAATAGAVTVVALDSFTIQADLPANGCALGFRAPVMPHRQRRRRALLAVSASRGRLSILVTSLPSVVDPEELDTTSGGTVGHVPVGQRPVRPSETAPSMAVAARVDTYNTSSHLREPSPSPFETPGCPSPVVLDVAAMESATPPHRRAGERAQELRARNGTLTLRGAAPATLRPSIVCLPVALSPRSVGPD